MVDILDHRGNPMNRKALKEPQTAKIAQLHREFANHPTRGLTPSKLAQILEDAERGDLTAQADLFEDMEEKDGHIHAELGKRKRALLGLSWDIKPPRNASAEEERVAGIVQDIILDMDGFEDVQLDMADGMGFGYSCLEYQWARIDGMHVPGALHHRPPGWFKTTQDNRNELRLRDNSADGAKLWPAGWIVHVHKAKSGYLARAGLHRALAWPFLFKNYSVRDLAEFLEIYGLPVRLGQYPRGASDSEKATLLRAVVNMGHAAAGIIPEGMMVEFKEAAQGGSDPFTAMMEWCERTESKVILGGTLTSQADGKSSTNALGNVHNEVRHDLLVSDAIQIGGTLTRDLVRVICDLNGLVKDPRRYPRFVYDTVEPEDLALYAESVPKLVDVGMPIPVSWVTDKLRIPKPEGDEPILQRAGASAQPNDPQQAKAPLKGETTDRPDADPTPVDAHTERLAKDAGPAVDSLVEVIRKKVDAAADLAALRDDLVNSYGDLDTAALTKIMELAFLTAELSGRYDVENE